VRFLQFSRVQKIIKQTIHNRVKPENYTLSVNVVTDLTRSKSELIVENAFLRQQLIIVQRQVKRPFPKPYERVMLVGLASRLQVWKQTLLIVQADTVLCWHRDLFKWVWTHKSKSAKSHPLSSDGFFSLARQ